MTTENPLGSAVKLRERGNELYKKGALDEAIEVYKAAALLDASDPYPLSNLSAAYFEAGAYADSIEATRKALENPEFPADPTSGKVQKLLVRSVKAQLHLSHLHEAKVIIEKILPGKDLDGLLSALEDAENAPANSAASDVREKLLQLPRLRPSIQDEPDFFGPGHDFAESLLTPQLSKSCANDSVWSFMLCGVGDARHVFKTIASCHSTWKKTGATSQEVYFTILDHKPAVLARVLIFFHLLEEASNPDLNPHEANLTLLTVSYLFCAQLIPSWAQAKFCDAAEKVESKLDLGQSPVDCCHIQASQMKGLSAIIHRWRHETTYSTVQLREQISIDIARTFQTVPGVNVSSWQFLEKCEREHRFFDQCSVMLPPAGLIKSFEPKLADLVSAYRAGKSGLLRQIDEHLDKTWSMNPTLIDFEWEANKEDIGPPDLGFDPFHIIEGLAGREYQRGSVVIREAMSSILNFFRPVSRALHDFQGKLVIEVIVGDMMHALESIRYNALERPNRTSPNQYHVIHNSNIPDYVGGALTSFLYAAPLLRQGNGTGLTSNVLRNPPHWKNVNQFNAEYLLMHDKELIRKHFALKLSNLTPKEEDDAGAQLPYYIVMMDYKMWESTGRSKLTLAERLPRGALFRWLYGHFFKLCLPFPRPRSDYKLVYAPLNMTAFMRLLDLAIELGYPTHWISSIISAIASGELTTTARAPRKYVLTPGAIDRVHESRTMSVQPWTDEFTTLAAMWRYAWPDGTAVLAKDTLPSLGDICQYSIQFPPFSALDLNYPHFALLFWNQPKYGSPPRDLRPILLDDENGDLTPSTRAIRANGVKMLSTFTWVRKTNTAGFWLRSDVIDKISTEGWFVYIWRIDVWGRLTEGIPIAEAVNRKGFYDTVTTGTD
ncbi:hypothetical protein F5Y18DRAFT_178241 [Xylariaceae sp. FL1019]|nr:hypothetical protein F5Y18DRAFT_178241 [Xylariaceae sp. FL1019]